MTTTGTALTPRFKPVIAAQVAVGFEQKHDFHLVPQADLLLLRVNARNQFEKDFRKYDITWKRKTQFFSSPADKYLHPSDARIIGMGRPAVSLILKSLRRQPADWFYALRAITGANPVTSAMAGDVKKMSEAWIKWGERQGLL